MFGSFLMAGERNPFVTHLGTYSSTTNRTGTIYPFTVSLGTEAPNRLIVAIATGAAENTNRIITTATLANVSMTVVASNKYQNTDTGSGALYSIVSNTGTTATFNLSHNGAPMYSVVVDVFSIIGLSSTSVFSANSGGSSGAISRSINVPERGVIIAGGGGWRTSTPYTWTGVNKVSELNAGDGGAALSSATLADTIEETARSISWSTPSASGRNVIFAASWK